MKLHGTMNINPAGNLEIGGCDTVKLVSEFGTPLYVMDEEKIRKNCKAYVESFKKYYPKSEVIYASKVFCTAAMCRLIAEEDMGLDVVSGGELYTALSVNFPVNRIYFHGNNKTYSELEMALDAYVGYIVVDNVYEMDLLNNLAKERKIKQKIMLRVSPGIDAHTHHYIKTGMIDSKFGLTITNGQAMLGIEKALNMNNLEVKGIHCHIGSQIFDLDSYKEAADIMMAFVDEIRTKTGIVCEDVNLGGGLGIYYTEDDSPRSIENLVEIVATAIHQLVGKYSLPLPKIIVEPGRSIVGEAGTTLYTVGSIKDIPGVRKYVAVDGGMTDNPRPALYQAQYEAAIANKMNNEPAEVVSIAGKCCESGDMLIWNINLPTVEPGDILAVSSTGAYNYSMASNYNRNLRPAVVFVENGSADIVVHRETYEDLMKNDTVPERLKRKKIC
ncbi:Diaminopimelate decarboxylase [bioreactor metagenome]|uniref:diaminopimelate decarboxylase n=1 Tax=bioreactor metagenome TaxID=1076179 RepID=A0A644T2Z0_9ZZZZ|nr:diaminopimelate decarboxylase [Negativicutes bacterium]